MSASPNITQTNTSVNPDGHFEYHCFHYAPAVLASTGLTVSKAFICLPFCILILHLGLQRWRRERSFAGLSHSDVFTFHLVAMQLLFVLGVVIFICGLVRMNPTVLAAGIYMITVIFPGQVLFHILTCVERYLAVVHPVTYLRLRQSEGVWIRNISIGCAWMLSLGWIGVTHWYIPKLPHVPILCFLVVSLVLVSFCNVSVLVALIRPGPGDMGGDRVRVAQTKQRAFYTISAILGSLLVFFIWVILALCLDWSEQLSPETGCMLLACGNLCNLPSDFVAPLLFLHRAGKLTCCHGNRK